MTEEASSAIENSGNDGGAVVGPKRRALLQLPGLAAIGLYLAAVGGVLIIQVVRGEFPAVFLIFAVLFFAAAAGLMLLLRWAWALALTAVLFLAVYNMWIFSSQQLAPYLVQGLLNWVFFLYMIRTEVRAKLK